MTASEMFGVPIEGMPSEVRRRAKAINFGIIYGISAFGLANQLGIPRDEAGAYIRKYFERFPGIRDYMEATKKTARANGYVTTIFGRKCHYPRINASNPPERAFNERAAINAPLQGSAADIIRRAMVAHGRGAGAGGLERADAAAGARRTGVRGAGRGGRGDDAGRGQGDGRGAASRRSSCTCRCRSTRARRRTGTRRIEVSRRLGSITVIASQRASGENARLQRAMAKAIPPRYGPWVASSPSRSSAMTTKSMMSIARAIPRARPDHRFEYDPAQAELAGKLDALSRQTQGL